MGLNILIVDDSAMVRTVMENLARKVEPEVSNCFKAANGVEAISILEREAITVVFADLHMPEMNGRELLDRIQAHDEWSNLPVIVFTSEMSDETEDDLSSRGAFACMGKPVTADDMRKVFDTLLGRTAQ